ncbi:MAG: hypothetical protein FJ144_19225 [Deltaproteobacteria bacterium]|nr:hypothetical protein [Deltaproteobacteria bacterium]
MLALIGATATPAASAPIDFLYCTPTTPTGFQYTCQLAAACEGTPCTDDWVPIAGEATLPADFFTPGGGRDSAIRVTPAIDGVTYTLVNKDLGGERWAIIENGTTRAVTGNVFEGAGGTDVQFLYCIEHADDDDSVQYGQCFLAPPCGAGGCNDGEWQSIGAPSPIPSSFFTPASGRGSGLQVTPDGGQILISKDVASQRWTITTIAAETTNAFPVGIGPALGNVFEVAIAEPTIANVVRTNGEIAFAGYEDSLATARVLRDRVLDLIANPSQQSFDAAKQAWLASREPYLQTEVYRFREGPIDHLREDGTFGEDGDGPEFRINAWPLAEALIDYVAPEVDGSAEPESGGPVEGVNGNVIADATNFPSITPEVIANLNQVGGDERNVATGYHAIEFLLWGQDLNADLTPGFGGRDATPGERPFTDYLPEGNGCTNGNCARRGQYLAAAVDLLISDLERMVAAWDPAGTGNFFDTWVSRGELSLAKMLEGMGRLGFGELAGERMNVALVANSQEDEHSCFSDNTHRDLLLDSQGILNTYTGRYRRPDGRLVAGPGIDALLVAEGHQDVADALTAALDRSLDALEEIDALAKAGTPFDNLIQQSIQQEQVVAAIEALKDQTDVIEDAIEALDLETGDLRQDTEEF